jgi:hypothetical protein
MTRRTDTIEIAPEVAEALRSRAARRGISVAELLAELVALDDELLALEPNQIAELERRWKAVADGRTTTVPNAEVVSWLQTWGTAAFRRWRSQ